MLMAVCFLVFGWRTLVEGTSPRVGLLDPIGANQPPGPGAYAAMMRDLGGALVDCLEGM